MQGQPGVCTPLQSEQSHAAPWVTRQSEQSHAAPWVTRRLSCLLGSIRQLVHGQFDWWLAPVAARLDLEAIAGDTPGTGILISEKAAASGVFRKTQ